MPLQRVVPQASADGARGKVIAGKYYLPPGTSIGMSAWNLHQSKEAFGKDAAEFKPERWLGSDRNELEKYNLSFGMGARVCLGKNISMMVSYNKSAGVLACG
jgi:cytochrome P450